MARFSGWNLAAIERLSKTTEIIPENIPTKKVKAKKVYPKYEDMLAAALIQIGLRIERQYLLPEDNRFIYDFYLPDYKTLVEFNGGIWMKKSGHNTGKALIRDAKKSTLAAMHGYKLFTFTTSDAQGKTWEYELAGKIERFCKTNDFNQKMNQLQPYQGTNETKVV